ncbi:hypothetical protein B1A99_34140 [Cohnella sp. CIP 111063]|uniref:DUF2273 domain-containing protein n=1 Tax=Cohnella cellulosilytica TaxID=986710 RepID=A0ABW2F659_9BACL|nr:MULTISPECIES: DUF2273 domain-containing protein [unclassified Cohnella]OXS52402.1 hypothetical protein B1A99_34140 [Cohnella sp. CIP 111063]PRX58259.1 putative membrane protein [Cohnella sp. SGD-V74]
MWKAWLETYGGRIAGIAAGLLFGIIYLISGFWDMLFCALLIGIGYWIGKQKDERRGPIFPLERLTDWVSDRWPWSR